MSAAFDRAMAALNEAKAQLERLQTDHEEVMYASMTPVAPGSLLEQLRSLTALGVGSVSLGHVSRGSFEKLVAAFPGGKFGTTEGSEFGAIRWYELELFADKPYPRLTFQTDYEATAP